MPIKRILMVLIVVIVTTIAIFSISDNDTESSEKIALISSIPLILGEVDVEQMARGESNPSAAYLSLKKQYDIVALDAIDDRLSQFNLLLMAQARPLSASELVALDKWVREGGAIIILSDAALQWHSEYALGDKRRPIFASLLSPLFAYWGLEQLLLLDNPDEQILSMDDYRITTVTPSEWALIDNDAKDVDCKLSDNKLEADCRVGKGRAILIGDSDFINEHHWRSYFGEDDNMRYLKSRLKLLSTSRK